MIIKIGEYFWNVSMAISAGNEFLAFLIYIFGGMIIMDQLVDLATYIYKCFWYWFDWKVSNIKSRIFKRK